MGLHPLRGYIRPMPYRTDESAPDRGRSKRPFDRLGVACLAWTGVFITLTAALSLTLK
jgi:hypothetical protein